MTQPPEDSILYLKMLVSHMSQLSKIVPVSGLQSLRHKHSQANVCEPKQSTHIHTHTPARWGVCLQRSPTAAQCFITAEHFYQTQQTETPGVWCDAAVHKPNNTTEQRERHSAASGLSVLPSVCTSKVRQSAYIFSHDRVRAPGRATIGRLLWYNLKYLPNYQMEYHEILCRNWGFPEDKS